ncbi:MAG: GNAT family N-acetyltransferase [Culicoidibacterales bacterium]
MRIEKATMAIIPEIEFALPNVVSMMQAMNNPQWSLSYPRVHDFKQDIEDEHLFCFIENDEVVGVAALILEPDLWFYELEHNNQIMPIDDEVMYVHRIFVFPQFSGNQYGKNIYACIIDYAKSAGHLAVQVDTHENNIPMNKTLLRSGFTYTGSRGRDNREGLWNMYEYLLTANQ